MSGKGTGREVTTRDAVPVVLGDALPGLRHEGDSAESAHFEERKDAHHDLLPKELCRIPANS
jgi:hypothetical protein